MKKTVLFSLIALFVFTIPIFALNSMDEGWKLCEQKKYSEALVKFKEAALKEPLNGWAVRAAGWVLRTHLNKPLESIPYYQKALTIIPEEPLFHFEYAMSLAETGSYKSAVTYFDKAMKFYKKSGNPPDWVFSSMAYYYRGIMKNPAGALPALEAGYQLYPAYINIQLEYGQMYSDLKQHAKALEWYLSAVALYKEKAENPQAWLLLNIAGEYLFHLEKKSPLKAIEYLKMVQSGDYSEQDRDTAADWIGYAYYLIPENELFLPAAREYVLKGLNPDAARAHADRLANYYYSKGLIEEARFYAGKSWPDFWIKKLLAPKIITIKGKYHLKSVLTKLYSNYKPGIYLVPLPMDTEYQTLVRFKSSIAYNRIIKEGPYNLAEIDFSKGFPKIWTFELEVRSIITNIRPSRLEYAAMSDESPGYYANLKDAYFDYDNPLIKKKVSELTSSSNTPLQNVVSIHQWVSSNIPHFLTFPEYRKKMPDGSFDFNISKLPRFSKISEVYTARRGDCVLITDLFMGMCRAVNIPAMTVWGMTVSGDVNRTSGACLEHYTALLYDPDRKGWFYVEPQKTNYFGVNQFWHIVMSTDELEKKYPGLIDILNIHSEEYYYNGYLDCLNFEIKIEQ